MKPVLYYSLISVFCLFIQTGKAQSYFNNRYDIASGNCDGSQSISNFKSNFLVTGNVCTSTSYFCLNLDIVDQNGIVLNSKIYKRPGSNFQPTAGKNIILPNSDFLVGGWRVYRADTSLAFLWRFNANLDSIKYSEYGYLNKLNYISSIIQMGKYVYMAGSVDSLSKNADILLIKTDTLGNEIWKKKIGIPIWDETAYCINVCANGDLLISGVKTAHGGSQQGPYVMRTDSSGAIIWQNYYPSANYANGSNDIKELPNGDIVFTGGKAYNITADGTLRKPTFTRLTANGTVVWQKEYGARAVGHDFFTFLINERNHFVVSGEIFKTDNTGSGMVYELNQNGDSLFSREYRILPNSQNYFRDVVQAPDKGYCFSGFVIPLNGDGGTEDIWLLKVDSNFCESVGVCTTGIHDRETALSHVSVYPNPAANEVYFQFGEQASTPLLIELSNAQGSVIAKATIKNTDEPYRFNLSEFAEGIYVYKVNAGAGYLKTGKFVVIK